MSRFTTNFLDNGFVSIESSFILITAILIPFNQSQNFLINENETGE